MTSRISCVPLIRSLVRACTTHSVTPLRALRIALARLNTASHMGTEVNWSGEWNVCVVFRCVHPIVCPMRQPQFPLHNSCDSRKNKNRYSQMFEKRFPRAILNHVPTSFYFSSFLFPLLFFFFWLSNASLWKGNNFTLPTLWNGKDESLWNSHWCFL